MSPRISLLRLLGVPALGAIGLLTGCGLNMSETAAAPASTHGVAVSGSVHGGVYPIQGATIRLMETQSNGVWAAASRSYKGTAKQLLQTTSDSNGYFTFPDTGWTCDAGQYAYITVSSGHTASNATNNNVVQVGVIGGCSTDLATKGEIDNVNVFVSELSTVAAAYALGNFMSVDSTNASSGQQLVHITAPAANNSASPGCTQVGNINNGTQALSCTHAGLANGFANAFNLVDSVRYDGSFPTGQARTTLPGNSQATVPQALINTMGNILQSCVDSPGGAVSSNLGLNLVIYSDGSHCGDLFYAATPPYATLTPATPPTNTLQVALNMARYPTNNVDALFSLQPRAVFFTPDLTSDKLSNNSSTLMAFTVSIFYLGTGVSGDTGMPYPVDVALDDQDNAYVLYTGDSSGTTYGAVDGFAPNGNGLFAGAHQARVPNPISLAMDSTGKAWVSNDTAANASAPGAVFSFNTPSSGGTSGSIGTMITVANGYPAGVAVDSSDNVWASRDASDSNQSLFMYQASKSYASATLGCQSNNSGNDCNRGTVPPAFGLPTRHIAIDGNQSVWGVSSSGSTNAKAFNLAYGVTSNKSLLYNTALNTSAGLTLAVDSSGNAYFPMKGTLKTLSATSAGAFSLNPLGLNSSNSGTGFTYNAPMGTSLDGAGNIFWTDFEASGQVFMMAPSSGSITAGTVTSFFPCYPLNGQCYSGAASYLRGLAIDSSGAMWYVADSATGAVVQTLGLASPAWPLLSYAHSGAPVQ